MGFGGGCHWCTEAMFVSLLGVERVEQGWIASDGAAESLSEAVIVTFDPRAIDVRTLVGVHLHSHASTVMHRFRDRYRSAIYVVSDVETAEVRHAMAAIQPELAAPIITEVLPLRRFVLNEERYLDYYRRDPSRPFCQTNIEPKLARVRERFPGHLR